MYEFTSTNQNAALGNRELVAYYTLIKGEVSRKEADRRLRHCLILQGHSIKGEGVLKCGEIVWVDLLQGEMNVMLSRRNYPR